MQVKTIFRIVAAALTSMLLASAVAEAMPGDHLKTTEYGKVGDWTLRVAKSPSGRVEICDAYVIAGSERALRIEFNPGGMVIAFNGLFSLASDKPMDVEVWFDGNRAESKVYKMGVVADSTDETWRGLTETDDGPSGLLDMFSNLSAIHFAYMVPGSGPHTESFRLKDTNAVVKRTLACKQEGRTDAGSGPGGVPAPGPSPANAAAMTAGADGSGGKQAVIRGSCKLKIDGRTYVDIRKACPIWLANDGTGRFWINTDRAGYLGDYFAEVAPAGNGTASVNWNGIEGGTHAQNFLGEDFRKAPSGCWANSFAEVCATR